MSETHGPLVLLVEDDLLTAKAYAATLRRLGCEVAHVATCSAARAMAAQMIPALAIFDLRLPDCDGAALAAELRRLPGWASVPMVAFSGAIEIDAEQGPEGPFVRWVPKPSARAEFEAMIGLTIGGAYASK